MTTLLSYIAQQKIQSITRKSPCVEIEDMGNTIAKFTQAIDGFTTTIIYPMRGQIEKQLPPKMSIRYVEVKAVEWIRSIYPKPSTDRS